MAVSVRGNFGTYALSSDVSFPDDEEAVAEAASNMFNMCGNAGQEAMIGDLLEEFSEWALQILESETDTRGSSWSEFAEMVVTDWYDGQVDKWEGTSQIWAEGWIAIAEQSGYHDSSDEYGEGTGQEFYGRR